MHLSCVRNGAMLIWHNAGPTGLTLFNTWSIPGVIVHRMLLHLEHPDPSRLLSYHFYSLFRFDSQCGIILVIAHQP